MTKPWELKVDDTRLFDTKFTFIIFCEDKSSEPLYFESFRNDNFEIRTIKGSKQHHNQVDYASDYCKKNDLLEQIEGKYFLKFDVGIQVWCVFDRDFNPNESFKDFSFTDSINTAIERGFKTAWSNDAFELWILLHFEEVDFNDISYKLRTKYYERLTEICKKFDSLNNKEKRIIEFPNFYYKEDLKSIDRFKDLILPRLKNKHLIAIERAKKLENFHDISTKPHHEKSPCTMVHILIEEFLRFSK
ncbi:MAG: RloB domain-containing protein [Bacteroidetes bacterium]|nr:MAG: RloB domain-containing protein [Bacteroidota bacterium]